MSFIIGFVIGLIVVIPIGTLILSLFTGLPYGESLHFVIYGWVILFRDIRKEVERMLKR